MKKTRLKTALFIALLIGSMLLSGCGQTTKEAMSAAEVAAELQAQGYTVSDTPEDFGAGYTATLAAENDSLHVEFYELEQASYAQSFHQNVLSSISEATSASTTVSGQNYSIVKVTASGTFYIVTYIDQTVLIVTGPKNAAKELASALGYN